MEEATTKSGMSTGMIIGIAVVVAIVFGGGVYTYVNNKAEKEKKDLNAQITELQSQVSNVTTATTATDETADWKTYSDSEFKYSIKYPNDWLSEDVSYAGETVYLLTSDRKKNFDAGERVRAFDVSVTGYSDSSMLPNNQSKKLSFENWIKQEADSFGFIQRKSIVVDGVSGYQGVGSGDGESYLIFVQKGNLIYQIETGDTTVPTTTEQKVINSFKFLEFSY